MTPDEWAEVFLEGYLATLKAPGDEIEPVMAAMYAMHMKCNEIDRRGRVQEDLFMGKPIRELTYEEAITFQRCHDNRLVPERVIEVIGQIIAAGPKEDREPIAILPPTVLIQGGRNDDG